MEEHRDEGWRDMIPPKPKRNRPGQRHSWWRRNSISLALITTILLAIIVTAVVGEIAWLGFKWIAG